MYTYPNQKFCNKYSEKNKTPYQPTTKKKILVYLITCNSNKCKAQYVGYTQRACKQRLLEHLTDRRSPVHRHLEENNHERRRITMHILTQAPTEEKDTETWLKQQEYNWICKLGTLTKTSMKQYLTQQ